MAAIQELGNPVFNLEIVTHLENHLKGPLLSQALKLYQSAATIHPKSLVGEYCQEALLGSFDHAVNSILSLAKTYQKIRHGEAVEILPWPNEFFSFYLGNGGDDYAEKEELIFPQTFDLLLESDLKKLQHFGATTLGQTTIQCLFNADLAAVQLQKWDDFPTPGILYLSTKFGHQITDLQIGMRTNSLGELFTTNKIA